ncbi:LysR family transcriptional regulator [Mycobacterium kansasii]
MELRHLRYFLAAAEAGNVTRAAERCFVAQSALSTQIARLEAEVGSELFVRSARGVRLTAAGEALRPRAEHLLAVADKLKADMAALRGILAGSLRIGMIQGAPQSLDLVGLIAEFHSRYPDVDISVRTGASNQLARDVLDSALDLAIVATRPEELPGALLVTPLFNDPLVAVVMSDDLILDDQPVSLDSLAQMGPFIHHQSESGLRQSVNAAFERAQVAIDSPFELDQIADMVKLVAAGAGVTIVPSSAVPPETVARLSLTVLKLQDTDAQHTVNAVTTAGPSTAATAFVDMLRSH